MFTSETIVKGNYVSGTIKKNNGNQDPSKHPYLFHSGLNFSSRGNNTDWTSEKLKNIAKEILDVAAEIDKQNMPNEISGTVFLDNDIWRFESETVAKVLCRYSEFSTLKEVTQLLSNDGWEYRWTHANGEEHYFYKELK